MWLRRTLTKIKVYWISNYYTTDQTNDQYLAYINALDPELFKTYSVTTACMFKLSVIYHNLETYIDKLKYLNLSLNDDRLINSDWCRYIYTEVTLEKFLINNRNIYSDPVDTLKEFKHQYIVFCKHVLDINKSETNKQEHNLRILTAFSSHLNAITLFFLRYKHDS